MAASPAGEGGDDLLEVVRAHVAAFNEKDLETVVGQFAEDALFATGHDVLVGRRAIRGLFADAFAAPFEATLDLRSAIVEGDTAACELLETLRLGGQEHTIPLAAFYTLRSARLVRVKVYREGSAEVAAGG